MKLTTIYTIILLCLVCIGTFVYGFVPIYNYKDVKVKLYKENINISECIDTFDLVPEKYYEGLYFIKINPIPTIRREGTYIWANGINIFTDCGDSETLIHELAHHWQFMAGDRIYNALEHQGKFCYYYHKIWDDSFPDVYDMEFEFNYQYYCEDGDIKW